MPTVPIGVISSDAIEHLDPLVPLDSASTDQPIGDLFGDAGSVKEFDNVRLAKRGNVAQLLFTTIPLMLIDVAALALSMGATALVMTFFDFTITNRLGLQCVGVLLGHLAIGSVLGIFPATAVSPVLELRQLVRSISLSFGLMFLLNQIIAVLSLGEIVMGSLSLMIAVFLLPLSRALGRFQLGRCEWFGERALIIGSGPQARAIFEFYRRSPSRGLRPVGIVSLEDGSVDGTRLSSAEPRIIDDNRGDLNSNGDRRQTSANRDSLPGDGAIPVLGTIHDIRPTTIRYDIRWGIVAPAGSGDLSMNEIMKFTTDLRHLIVLPSQVLLPSLWANARECAGVLGVHMTDQLHRPGARAIKAIVDTTVALVALFLLSPLMAVMVLWVKIKSPGPAFYGHTRIGRGGEKFRAWKIRTMVTNADEVLEAYLEENSEARQQWMLDQKLKDDPRIIPGIGQILRKTSLDELPQLFNVLAGEMSLVGPRPIVTSEIARYGEMYPFYLRVTPGITGLWQVSGRNDTSYAQRVRLDCYYVCNWSVWLDFYIGIRTIRTLMMREGAY